MPKEKKDTWARDILVQGRVATQDVRIRVVGRALRFWGIWFWLWAWILLEVEEHTRIEK